MSTYCGNYPEADHTGCPSSVECYHATMRSDEYVRSLMVSEERQDMLEVSLDSWLPGWEQDERRAYGEIVGERDVPVTDDTDWETDDTDWQAWLEETYVDPTEREF